MSALSLNRKDMSHNLHEATEGHTGQVSSTPPMDLRVWEAGSSWVPNSHWLMNGPAVHRAPLHLRSLCSGKHSRERQRHRNTAGGPISKTDQQKPEARKGDTAKQVSQHICRAAKGRVLRKGRCKFDDVDPVGTDFLFWSYSSTQRDHHHTVTSIISTNKTEWVRICTLCYWSHSAWPALYWSSQHHQHHNTWISTNVLYKNQ